MKKHYDPLQKILNEPSYWVEAINGELYDAIVKYMKKHHLKREGLAKHLGISRGRVSQILNDGEINFSIKKLIEIALKIDKYPVFELKNKTDYLKDSNRYSKVIDMNNDYWTVSNDQNKSFHLKENKKIKISI